MSHTPDDSPTDIDELLNEELELSAQPKLDARIANAPRALIVSEGASPLGLVFKIFAAMALIIVGAVLLITFTAKSSQTARTDPLLTTIAGASLLLGVAFGVSGVRSMRRRITIDRPQEPSASSTCASIGVFCRSPRAM